MNNRQRIRILLGASALVLCGVTVAGLLLSGSALKTDFSQKNIAPGLTHFFGTDWMGRDMLIRTLAGLSLSIRIGILAAIVSAVLALSLIHI